MDPSAFHLPPPTRHLTPSLLPPSVRPSTARHLFFFFPLLSFPPLSLQSICLAFLPRATPVGHSWGIKRPLWTCLRALDFFQAPQLQCRCHALCATVREEGRGEAVWGMCAYLNLCNSCCNLYRLFISISACSAFVFVVAYFPYTSQTRLGGSHTEVFGVDCPRLYLLTLTE